MFDVFKFQRKLWECEYEQLRQHLIKEQCRLCIWAKQIRLGNRPYPILDDAFNLAEYLGKWDKTLDRRTWGGGAGAAPPAPMSPHRKKRHLVAWKRICPIMSIVRHFGLTASGCSASIATPGIRHSGYADCRFIRDVGFYCVRFLERR
ncbi:MAG: hypothetical protein ACE5HE_12505 [Phycisphaerae bacterium]